MRCGTSLLCWLSIILLLGLLHQPYPLTSTLDLNSWNIFPLQGFSLCTCQIPNVTWQIGGLPADSGILNDTVLPLMAPSSSPTVFLSHPAPLRLCTHCGTPEMWWFPTTISPRCAPPTKIPNLSAHSWKVSWLGMVSWRRILSCLRDNPEMGWMALSVRSCLNVNFSEVFG